MSDRPVTYIAPTSDDIRQYSRDVCAYLAQTDGDENYLNPDVVNGLGECLELVAELTAKYVNRGHYELLDKAYA